MKKIISLLLFGFCVANMVVSKPIDTAIAKLVGQNFISKQPNSTIIGTPNLELVYTSSSKTFGSSLRSVTNYFYVFNINKNRGFLIISADDIVKPVLGYSFEDGFESKNIAPQVKAWLEGYSQQISFAIDNNIATTSEITMEWKNLISGTVSQEKLNKKGGSVNPLIKTKWNQYPYYNDSCPFVGSSPRAVTGCVATAMAQVMKYWNYPNGGIDSKSYTHPKYGKLTVDFSTANYNWSLMPYSLNSTNAEVAKIMYHGGVSMEMNYGQTESGAWPDDARYALKTYFGYKPDIKYESRSSYSDIQWLALLKSELDNGRPIIYSGYPIVGSGHCFIADGYDNTDYLHFNWGWGGICDGFYSINGLNPNGYIFKTYHSVIIGIEPANPLTLSITKDLKPSTPLLVYGKEFTVSTNIINKGTKTVMGKYCALILNKNHEIVSYSDTIYDGLAANSTYKNDLIFNFKGNDSLLAGNYNIELYYQPNVGNWQQIRAANSSIKDTASLEVIYTIFLEVNSELTPKVFRQNDPVSLILDLSNTHHPTFYGKYRICLLNLDSSVSEIIDTVFESKGLLFNNSYKSPYLKFNSANVNSKPGKYLALTQFMADSTDVWVKAGSKKYTNPVEVLILDQPFEPDIYEINNIYEESYTLPLNFTNNIASVQTKGSNFHRTTDEDYYKIVLPAGYNYYINARVQDLKWNSDGQNYSSDASFIYTLGGGSWSGFIKDSLPDKLLINGGKTVYFLLLPGSPEDYGTYLFDIKIIRMPVSAKDIIDFSLTDMTGLAFIDENLATVKVNVNSSTDVKTLAPSILISPFASINPQSGVIKDFSNPVVYTVTAYDKSIKKWTVTVTKPSGSIAANAKKDLIKMYPNPANDYVYFNLSEPSVVKIYSVYGSELRSQNFEKGKGILDIKNLFPGNYIIEIFNGKTFQRELFQVKI